MNQADDEWGEERLIDAVRAVRAAPVKAIPEHVVKSADVFVGGAPQYDDMTLIVARVE
jgi:serine phosphatase RsbU (regulator of sigma subunit)